MKTYFSQRGICQKWTNQRMYNIPLITIIMETRLENIQSQRWSFLGRQDILPSCLCLTEGGATLIPADYKGCCCVIPICEQDPLIGRSCFWQVFFLPPFSTFMQIGPLFFLFSQYTRIYGQIVALGQILRDIQSSLGMNDRHFFICF